MIQSFCSQMSHIAFENSFSRAVSGATQSMSSGVKSYASRVFNRVAPSATPQRYVLQRTAEVTKMTTQISLGVAAIASAVFVTGKYVFAPIGSCVLFSSRLDVPWPAEAVGGLFVVSLLGTIIFLGVEVSRMCAEAVKNDYANWQDGGQRKLF